MIPKDDNACRHCVPPERKEGCHDRCPKYKKLRAAIEANKRPTEDDVYFDYQRDLRDNIERNKLHRLKKFGGHR